MSVGDRELADSASAPLGPDASASAVAASAVAGASLSMSPGPEATPSPAQWGGLLSPVWAGTPIEPVCSDAAIIAAMLGVEAALARAQAKVGLIPASAAEVIGDVGGSLRIDPAALARRSRAAANPVVALVDNLATAVAAADPAAADHVHAGSTSRTSWTPP